MLKAIIVVRIARRIFSKHALRQLRALHVSNGGTFPHVGLPLLTAITNSPYASELPESAHTSVDELRTFLLDYTACSDELMERILFYLTRQSLETCPKFDNEVDQDACFDEEEECDAEQLLYKEGDDDGDEDNDIGNGNQLENVGQTVDDSTSNEQQELPEKKRRLSKSALVSSDGLRNTSEELSLHKQQKDDDMVVTDEIPDDDGAIGSSLTDDDDVINDENDEESNEDEDIPLDQLRQLGRRPKSVDSNMSNSWASVDSSNHSEAQSSTPNSRTTRRSARLSSRKA